MSIRTLLVPLDGGHGDRWSLDAAYAVARHFEAHITALHVEIDPEEAMAGVVASGIYSPTQYLDALERVNAAGETAPRATFDAWRHDRHVAITETPRYLHGVSARFMIERGVNTIRNRALLADLVVCPLFDDDRENPAALEAALLDAGRPVLAVPAGNRSAPDFDLIAVAWSASREGFRALTAALPLMRTARELVILHAGEWQPAKLAPIIDYLAWHGLSARGVVLPGGDNQGDTLLDEARRLGAKLLVMGGYTHSRARQRVFGGVTRHLLRHSDIPLWLSH